MTRTTSGTRLRSDTPRNSTPTWKLGMHPETAGYLISRTTILILCGILGGIILSFQLSTPQKLTVATACVVGIVAFVTVDGGLNSHLLANQRRLRETRNILNKRIDLQLAFLDSQIRDAELESLEQQPVESPA